MSNVINLQHAAISARYNAFNSWIDYTLNLTSEEDWGFPG